MSGNATDPNRRQAALEAIRAWLDADVAKWDDALANKLRRHREARSVGHRVRAWLSRWFKRGV